jgi:hypothetical protein
MPFFGFGKKKEKTKYDWVKEAERYGANQKEEEALAAIDNALKIDPEFGPAWMTKAKIVYRPDEKIDCLREALKDRSEEFESKRAWCHIGIAQVHCDDGNYTAAQVSLFEAGAYEPSRQAKQAIVALNIYLEQRYHSKHLSDLLNFNK